MEKTVEVRTYYSKRGDLELKVCLGTAISTNWCLLSLPLDTWVSLEHSG